MSSTNWLDVLGWDHSQMEDLRFVGFSYIKQGKYDIAIKFFEALSILEPEGVYDLQTLGALYLQTGNNLSALDFLERAIKINNTHAPTLLNRAKAMFLLGYKKQAVDQATFLQKNKDQAIATQATALIMSYR
ncbi:MAG: hypothetical protein S4CHLAM37_02310 [Chlamydiia bacterium]|nr:hypothetical protein [Chlamydiia bacterium]